MTPPALELAVLHGPLAAEVAAAQLGLLTAHLDDLAAQAAAAGAPAVASAAWRGAEAVRDASPEPPAAAPSTLAPLPAAGAEAHVRHQAAVVVDLAERLLESHSGVAGVARAAVEGLVAELRRAAPPPLAAAS